MSFRGGQPDQAREIRQRLTNPVDVCRGLNLDDGARRHGRGLLIRCPWHADRRPSCSVFRGDDGTIGVKCFSCAAKGDVLHLVAVAHGVDARGDFPHVLELAAELAGVDLARRPEGVARYVRRPSTQGAANTKPPVWPPRSEVVKLWEACPAVGDSPEVSRWLMSRSLKPGDIEAAGLARALPPGPLPGWSRCNRRSWWQGGYRCIVPMFDHTGAIRSLRARQVLPEPGDQPKAVPPAGHSVSGLVMADALARSILTTGRAPDVWPPSAVLRIIIVEGEPNFFTWAVAFSDSDATAPAVMGMVNGCWTTRLAARIPDRARVILRTDHDAPGERYAREIYDSISTRCTVLRGGARDCELCHAFGWSRGVP